MRVLESCPQWLSDSVLDMMSGRTVIEAEIALDTARRIIWVHVFSGRSFEAVAKELDASQEAVNVAVMVLSQVARNVGDADGSASPAWSMLQGFAFMDRLFSEVRLTLYFATYQSDAESRFGQFAKSWREEAARYAERPATPGTLN